MNVQTEPNVMRAFMAFREVLQAGMRPTMSSEIQQGSDWRRGEYDILIAGSSVYGVLHEEIEQLLKIADTHGGRLWLHRSDGKLCILFPYEHPEGPEGPNGEEPVADGVRRKARGGRRVKAEAPS